MKHKLISKYPIYSNSVTYFHAGRSYIVESAIDQQNNKVDLSSGMFVMFEGLVCFQYFRGDIVLF